MAQFQYDPVTGRVRDMSGNLEEMVRPRDITPRPEPRDYLYLDDEYEDKGTFHRLLYVRPSTRENVNAFTGWVIILGTLFLLFWVFTRVYGSSLGAVFSWDFGLHFRSLLFLGAGFGFLWIGGFSLGYSLVYLWRALKHSVLAFVALIPSAIILGILGFAGRLMGDWMGITRWLGF